MSSPTPMEGGDDEDVPLNRLSKDIGEKKRRQNSFEDDAIETEDETSTADTDSGEDEDTGEDAIDWYDGKILSYSDGNFVVYFLGDEEDVTYTMPLTPKSGLATRMEMDLVEILSRNNLVYSPTAISQ